MNSVYMTYNHALTKIIITESPFCPAFVGNLGHIAVKLYIQVSNDKDVVCLGISLEHLCSCNAS